MTFELGKADKNGISLLTHLMEVKKQSGQTPTKLKQFNETEAPLLGSFYSFWLALHERRQYSEYGPMPLTFPEIKAWKELMEEDVSSYGVEVICSIDRLYLKHQMKKV